MGAIKNRQSTKTDYIGYTRHRTNKRQRIPKGQSKIDNPEKLETQGTQDEETHNKNTTQQLAKGKYICIKMVVRMGLLIH